MLLVLIRTPKQMLKLMDKILLISLAAQTMCLSGRIKGYKQEIPFEVSGDYIHSHSNYSNNILQISNLNDPLTELFRRLKHQKQRTKDGSLGVVFLGTKETATHLLTQLNFEAEDLQDIVWVMPATVGKDINVYNSLVDGAANKTIVFSRFSTEASSIKDFVHQKWASAMNDSFSPNGHLDAIMACTGKQTIPEWTNEIIEPAVDAVYVLASALKRQQRLYCPGMEGKCANLSFNFKLDSDLKFNPLNYADLPADMTVPEFAAVMKEVRFTEDRELSSSGVLPVYDIDIYLRKDNNFHFTKVGVFCLVL